MNEGGEFVWGLSPLARGNPAGRLTSAAGGGPIPARTGQPLGLPCCWLAGRAYPRSHGATSHKRILQSALLGLSPLARGNRQQARIEELEDGPIPARTGQPSNQ